MQVLTIVGVIDMKHINVEPLGTTSKKDTAKIKNTKVRSKRLIKLLNLPILLLHIVMLELMKSHLFHLAKMLGIIILVQHPT